MIAAAAAVAVADVIVALIGDRCLLRAVVACGRQCGRQHQAAAAAALR